MHFASRELARYLILLVEHPKIKKRKTEDLGEGIGFTLADRIQLAVLLCIARPSLWHPDPSPELHAREQGNKTKTKET